MHSMQISSPVLRPFAFRTSSTRRLWVQDRTTFVGTLVSCAGVSRVCCMKNPLISPEVRTIHSC